MTPLLVFSVIAIYFLVLIIISRLTSDKGNNKIFFTADRRSPWYLVAFGMIGASLSGVTFISVPGDVGNNAMSYFQIVIGYLLGYAVIAFVLLPLYYKMNLVSIYSYLNKRFGKFSYKTGAFFFLISQTIGASLRLFLVAGVLQIGLFNAIGLHFYLTIAITIIIIWLYTAKGGIKTIVWTDSLQTLFMLLAVGISIYTISSSLDFSLIAIPEKVFGNEHGKIFSWDWKAPDFIVKHFFSGAFIAIVMTGLDQNMMQKNLSCKTLKEAQKNMITFSLILIPVNMLFLFLGVLLYMYIDVNQIVFSNEALFFFDTEASKFVNTDYLFPQLAFEHFSLFAGIVFLLGIIAAAFSSADSALTALTTSFCIDILGIELNENEANERKRKLVHIIFSFVMLFVIVIFDLINEDSVISAVFKFAGYTYGPLLGLYSFGLFTKRETKDFLVPLWAVSSPILTFVINKYSEYLLFGYKFGFELIIVNGGIMFMFLLMNSKRKKAQKLTS